MKTAKLKWAGADYSECGRYAIQTEHVRGESPAYSAMIKKPGEGVCQSLSGEWWHRKRDAKAECQEHSDENAKGAK